jgi:MerR family transcriptional regulator, repressor of the yfmOP operon
MPVSMPRKAVTPSASDGSEDARPSDDVIAASEPVDESANEGGIRISDAATRAGVSARTLRYYEELGLLTPSLYTAGGERRYTPVDLEHLARILELREVLGMNLEEIREFLSRETRLDELRATYRAAKGATNKKARAEQKATLEEALVLNESLAEQISIKLARMDGFRAKLVHDAERCLELLAELD